MNSKNNFDDYTGVTTGSIATACAFAALKILVSDESIYSVNIEAPKDNLEIIIDDYKKISENSAMAKAHKYPYNDPDVTVNVEIVANVKLFDSDGKEEVIISGGKGVGIITKLGLQIPVGDYAINPVPRKMIDYNLKTLLPKGKSVKVEISIPEGEIIAKKTMNPKLGIVGGISVIGTTGIARSMSSKAYKDSIVYQIHVANASNIKDLVFVPGNIGEKLALKKLNINKNQIIQTGNFIGFMFEEAEKSGIKSLTFFGHIGKLIKVAGGIFNTKHAVADGRKEIMITHAVLNGASYNTIKKLYTSKTTEDMMNILEEENISKLVSNSIANAIKERCKIRFNLDINVILVDMEGNILNTNYFKV